MKIISRKSSLLHICRICLRCLFVLFVLLIGIFVYIFSNSMNMQRDFNEAWLLLKHGDTAQDILNNNFRYRPYEGDFDYSKLERLPIEKEISKGENPNANILMYRYNPQLDRDLELSISSGFYFFNYQSIPEFNYGKLDEPEFGAVIYQNIPLDSGETCYFFRSWQREAVSKMEEFDEGENPNHCKVIFLDKDDVNRVGIFQFAYDPEISGAVIRAKEYSRSLNH